MEPNFYQFVMVSKKTDDCYRIMDEIRRNKLYRVEQYETARESLLRLGRGDVHCLVFNLDTFSSQKIQLASDLRDLGFSFPILIFATHVQKEALDIVKTLDRVVVIEKPFEAKDVWGICQKLVQGMRVNQRIFRRFYTNQNAVIEKSLTGDQLVGHIFNLSRGGAYMEIKGGSVSPGEIIRLTIQLEKVSRLYNVEAEVVWSTSRGFWKGRPAAGLRFVQAGDVYRNLLDKL